MEGNF